MTDSAVARFLRSTLAELERLAALDLIALRRQLGIRLVRSAAKSVPVLTQVAAAGVAPIRLGRVYLAKRVPHTTVLS
mgnify:CR=1 FL=1